MTEYITISVKREPTHELYAEARGDRKNDPFVRELLAIYNRLSAVERAYILSGEGWRPGQEER